jgi:hypothetical protein
MTARHATVRSLTRRVEGVTYMDHFFSSTDMFDDQYTGGINSCGTVRQNCEGIPRVLDRKKLKLDWGDIHARVRGNLTALVWKEARCVHFDKYA